MTHQKIVEKSSYVVFCVIVLCIMQSFAFFQTDSPLYNSTFGFLYLGMLFVPFFYIITYGAQYLKIEIESIFLLLSIATYWLMEFIHSYGNLNLYSSFFFFFILPYCFLKSELQARAYCCFRDILYWMSICGIIISILYYFNIVSPFSIVEYYDNAESQAISYYANYYVGYLQINDYGLTRFCGLFNEPGLFGTIAALILIANRMQMNKQNIIIMIACLFSFSVACLVLIVLYYILRTFLARKIKIMICITILLGIFVYLTTIEFEDTNLKMFFQRFSFDGGSIIEDDRTTSAFNVIWNRVINNPDMLWFGYGQALPNLFSSTYKIFIVKHGIFGTILIFFPFLLACFKMAHNNKDGLLLITMFFISIYQRPQIFNLTFFVVLFGGVRYLALYKRQQVSDYS